jgi:hypothetical protein
MRLTVSEPHVSRLSGQCGILNISQSYGTPRAVTGIAILFSISMMFVPNRKHVCASTVCYRNRFTLLLEGVLNKG